MDQNKNSEKHDLIKDALDIFLDNETNVWFSVRNKSLVKILDEKGFHKKMASILSSNLLKANVIEKRGVTSGTEYKIVRKPTNLNEIIENSLNDYSKQRNKEYIYGKEILELGKKYYMVFSKKIYEVQVVGVNIKKNNEILYNIKKPINSKNATTILKNIKYKDIYLTITSAGDVVKNCAISECKFISK